MTRSFVWAMLIAVSATMLPNPVSAAADLSAVTLAQAKNKTQLVFEIKSFKIPSASEIADMLDGQDDSNVKTGPEAPVAAVSVAKTAAKVSYNIPPKKIGDERVYMHEPEIRAYICSKLGDKCNIFIAVLKAENGTHECTRDNRGLNRNGSVDIGLAQINWRPGSPHSFEQLQDCKYNLDVALEMYSRRGFQPWYAYTKGAYKKHLPAVLATAKIVAPAEVAVAVQ